MSVANVTEATVAMVKMIPTFEEQNKVIAIGGAMAIAIGILMMICCYCRLRDRNNGREHDPLIANEMYNP